jgi:hypothetical protein
MKKKTSGELSRSRSLINTNAKSFEEKKDQKSKFGNH